MTDPPDRRWAWFALATVAFGTSYALLPLYSSNQNHHFLTGIARAGEGWLERDWLTQTVDPFPVFTAFITLVHRYLNDALYYLLYYLLLGTYAYGLVRVVEHVFPPRDGTRAAERLALLAVICVLHNEVIGYLAGVGLRHLPWWQLTHWGVAEQEIFGHGMFQPSAIGLLLPLALAWHLEGRSTRATVLMGLVLLVHFSYVILVASLTLAFMMVELQRSHSLRRPIVIGAIALAFAAPVLVYVLGTLGPTTPETARRAAGILVEHIPQEADPRVWLGPKAWVQVVLMIAGVSLAIGTDLLLPLLFPLLAGVALTSAQITSGHPQLALLFPWRVSVLLVPIATALAVRALIARAFERAEPRVAPLRRVATAAAVALAVSMLAGAVRMALNFAYFYDYRPMTASIERFVSGRLREDFGKALRPDTLAMMRFAREAAARDDLYVVPPDLERFRLRAGVPILVDLKSHPYKDVEVLEWFTRLQLVNAFYESGGDCGVLRAIENQYPVTHVVFDARVRSARCPGLIRVYSDAVFDIYRVRGTADATIRDRPCCNSSGLRAARGPASRHF